MPTPTEIKKALVAAGLEIYRTTGDVVHVAERVRENLLMDSGISIHATTPKVIVVLRAQRSDFPGDGDDRLFSRARSLADAAIERGFQETSAKVREVLDPSDAARRLDTWCEVHLEKTVVDVAAVVAEARFALALEKAATP